MRKFGKALLSLITGAGIFVFLLAASAAIVAVLLGLIICVSAVLSFIWAGFTPNFVSFIVVVVFVLWAFYPAGKDIVTNILER